MGGGESGSAVSRGRQALKDSLDARATLLKPLANIVSLERMSDLIGEIYDCVLDPGNWGPTLESINREFSFASSVLGVVPLHEGGHRINVTVGFDPEWLSIADDEAYGPTRSRCGAARSGRRGFRSTSRLSTRQGPAYPNLHNNRYFREILEPRDCTTRF